MMPHNKKGRQASGLAQALGEWSLGGGGETKKQKFGAAKRQRKRGGVSDIFQK